MAALSQTTIFRKSPPCTWCCVSGVASSNPPSASSRKSTTATR
uniref:Ribosomal protein L40 n=1 Tax=Myotis myotis TaxID=51298 RepID=A0A7J7XLA8_MYOMY|nr:ribosomal protein L40 [Myotis myotis]